MVFCRSVKIIHIVVHRDMVGETTPPHFFADVNMWLLGGHFNRFLKSSSSPIFMLNTSSKSPISTFSNSSMSVLNITIQTPICWWILVEHFPLNIHIESEHLQSPRFQTVFREAWDESKLNLPGMFASSMSQWEAYNFFFWGGGRTYFL